LKSESRSRKSQRKAVKVWKSESGFPDFAIFTVRFSPSVFVKIGSLEEKRIQENNFSHKLLPADDKKLYYTKQISFWQMMGIVESTVIGGSHER
jgi:hypothetical protein